MPFQRRTPRVDLREQALVTTGAAESVLGMLIDLGLGGAAILLTRRFAPGDPAKVLLQPSALEGAAGVSGLPVLPARVVAARRAGALADGALRFRTGFEFRALLPQVRAKLERLIAAAQSDVPGPTIEGRRAMELARSPRGREMLYQAAGEALAAGDPARAHELTRLLVAMDRSDVYRVLHHRAAAARALAEGDVERARSEVRRGLEARSDDPALLELLTWIEAHRPAMPGGPLAWLRRRLRG